MEKIGMRDAFGAALVELGKTNDKLMVLDADVSSSTRSGLFGKAYPDRFFNVGVAEANMVDIAAGMATCGYRPVVSAFAIFLALKATDQIRNVVCYNKLNVIIAGGYSGLSDSFDGASHQSITDIAIMRAFPNLTVLAPAHADDVTAALEQALEIEGPVYIRMCRNPSPVLVGKKALTIGKAEILNEGSDITIGACGITVPIAMEACEELASKGIKAQILDLSSIKPIDKKTITEAAEKTGCFLTVEEHSIHGGLGSAVSEVLVRSKPVPMDFVGIEDCFTESGPYEELMEKYGLSTKAVVAKAEALVKLK
ncbi:1-deoxy-D-xylulose-5-phosphate synthase [Oceanispirochaeta crateris]|uniref:1-deoxy-D-xylulose-5-phosphate synthase n=1 Tax=Oceanispirochaeta crateris TaxID=2518645 RepID=A0A5C1QLS2_9SPIO|nr:transketolase C-terminal domain-containing protein [Oceanispirochaeta crateris]QEN08278.1 1-deoxy-D-xylulose-5-phosphate synthase [Oceanispirochaeta crateris]